MELVEYIKPTSYYVLITFFFALLFLDRRKKANKYLSIILLVCLLTELISVCLIFMNYPIGLNYSISMIAHASLWIMLISNQILNKLAAGILLAAFLLFSFINLFFGEGLIECNFNTFIVGALLYIILFIYESFHQLKEENFSFFQSNNYLLLFSPILFFFGLSFVFGFKNRDLAETIVFHNVKLYDFIIYFVNIIYYTLINIYIYREKRLKNA